MGAKKRNLVESCEVLWGLVESDNQIRNLKVALFECTDLRSHEPYDSGGECHEWISPNALKVHVVSMYFQCTFIETTFNVVYGRQNSRPDQTLDNLSVERPV